MIAQYQIIQDNCLSWLQQNHLPKLHLSFVDPPFNQGKDYRRCDDSLPNESYWEWMQEVLASIHKNTEVGGCVYFMQREKNVEQVLNTLRGAGWTFQNLIVWKKKTSAVPSNHRYGKQYQIIATHGEKPRIFNRLRISPPLPPNYKYEREKGIYVTDIWEDIRELTSGYFAGDEALRDPQGDRIHKQQSPIALLLRIILSSTQVGDTVFDPFSGTGTTLTVSSQIHRNSIGIEIDPENIKCIERRLAEIRKSDSVEKYYLDYKHTENLDKIWGMEVPYSGSQLKEQQMLLLE